MKGFRLTGHRWANVAAAALLMVTTLPGRTHGLGLFTEPILADFGLGGERYALICLVATLAGAVLCVPAGWLLDRLGPRAVAVGVALPLAGVVVWMASWTGGLFGLAALILLTRGLGQSAMSVVSLGLVGRAVGGRVGVTMGVYSVALTVGFVAAFGVLRAVIKAAPDDWRGPWAGIGCGVFVGGLAAALLMRQRHLAGPRADDSGEPSRSLPEALRTGAFWAFAVGTSFYGMAVAGTSMFNESILAERGYPKRVFLNVVILGIPFGLAANLVGGYLATRVRLGRLFAAALVTFAAALASYPVLTAVWHAYVYAAALASAGGVVTVCFFTAWRRLYGPAYLGRIQGAAQMMTVVFSAFGPLLFAASKERLGAYEPLFPALAVVSVGLAALAWFVRTESPAAAG